jgi:hypothetical protein
MTEKAVAPPSEERLVDLLVAQVEQEDEPDEGPLFPLRLVQGDDDVVVEASRDCGGWSAEELAMHLVEEP